MCRYAMLSLSISMTRYSLFSLMRHALRGHQEWTPAWRTPDLASHYDVVIVGGEVTGWQVPTISQTIIMFAILRCWKAAGWVVVIPVEIRRSFSLTIN